MMKHNGWILTASTKYPGSFLFFVFVFAFAFLFLFGENERMSCLGCGVNGWI